jgi:uncharacterized protein YggE
MPATDRIRHARTSRPAAHTPGPRRVGLRSQWLAAAALLLAGLCLPTRLALAADAAEQPRIETRGEAVLRVPADQVEFNVAVISEDSTADRALARNTTKVNAVRRALEGAGLAADDIETGRFQLQPQWSSPPQDPQPSWRPTIVGFVVEHQVAVRTRKLAQAGNALTAASGAGANSIGELRFSLADNTKARGEAIQLATRNAIADADAIARAAGLTRGRILSVVLEPSFTAPSPVQMEMRAMAAMDKAVPVDAGAIEVRATVQLRVAIGD